MTVLPPIKMLFSIVFSNPNPPCFFVAAQAANSNKEAGCLCRYIFGIGE